MRWGGAILQRDGASRKPLGVVAAALMVAFALGGCGSLSQRMAGTASDLPVVGLPAETPARPVESLAFPAVHDVPAARSSSLMTGVEQKKFEDDLLAARQEQQHRSTPPPEKKAEKPKKPLASIRPTQAAAPRPVAPSSGAAIY
jgi:hypothetical protein